MRFPYRDRRDGDRVKTTTLPADEFIGRFLGHVLPDRFLRVRHYGFLANRPKPKLLARCRALLGVVSPAPRDDRPRTLADWLRKVLGTDPNCCPRCGDTLHRVPLPRVTMHPPCPHASPHGPHPTAPQPPSRPDPWDSS